MAKIETTNAFPLFLLRGLLPVLDSLGCFSWAHPLFFLLATFLLEMGQMFTHHCYLIFIFCTFPNSVEFFWDGTAWRIIPLFHVSLYGNMKTVSVLFLIIPSMKFAFFTAVTHGSWHTIRTFIMVEICLRVETLGFYFPGFPLFTSSLPTKQLLFVFYPVLWRKNYHILSTEIRFTCQWSPWYRHWISCLFI